MNEEHESMKNDVWDVVPRPQDKSVVTSKWLYKSSMELMGVQKSTSFALLLEASLKRKVWITMKYLSLLLDTPPSARS